MSSLRIFVVSHTDSPVSIHMEALLLYGDGETWFPFHGAGA